VQIRKGSIGIDREGMCDAFDIVEVHTECDIDVFCHAELAIKHEDLPSDDNIRNLRSSKSGRNISEDFLEHGY
jgi:hypothetical protein